MRQIRDRFTEIARGEYDIIIGTQLVAKGHHFPKLSLVGVIDADLGLAHGDPRAAEKTFQILTQVTGRAGRASGMARPILQTYHPEHPVMQAMLKGDREGFYSHELKVREMAGLPPFGRLAALIISGNDHTETTDLPSAFWPGTAGRRRQAVRARRCAGGYGSGSASHPDIGPKSQGFRPFRLCAILAGDKPNRPRAICAFRSISTR